MSHFTVLVLGDDVEGQLAPYDENIETDPRREYLDDQDPSHHWVIASSRRDGLEVPADADITWPWVIQHLRERFPDENVDDDDGILIDDDGQAYAMTTYNPDSKWDWYQIGGRWRGYFDLKPGAVGTLGEPGTFESLDLRDGKPTPDHTGKSDQALKADIDIDGMRQRSAERAGAEWDKAHGVLVNYPHLKGWSSFVERANDGSVTIEDARAEYNGQQGIEQSKKDLAAALGTEGGFFWDDPIDTYAEDRAPFVERAYLASIPGYALLIDGRWYAKGQMGWFGMGSDTPATERDYLREVNRLIDEASDDTLFTIVDCHI